MNLVGNLILNGIGEGYGQISTCLSLKFKEYVVNNGGGGAIYAIEKLYWFRSIDCHTIFTDIEEALRHRDLMLDISVIDSLEALEAEFIMSGEAAA